MANGLCHHQAVEVPGVITATTALTSIPATKAILPKYEKYCFTQHGLLFANSIFVNNITTHQAAD